MSDDKRGADADQVAQGVTGAEVGAFLRALAQRAESDPALAAQLQAALAESGLDGQAPAQREAARTRQPRTPGEPRHRRDHSIRR